MFAFSNYLLVRGCKRDRKRNTLRNDNLQLLATVTIFLLVFLTEKSAWIHEIDYTRGSIT